MLGLAREPSRPSILARGYGHLLAPIGATGAKRWQLGAIGANEWASAKIVSGFDRILCAEGAWKAPEKRFLPRPVPVPGRSEADNGSGKPPRFDPSKFQPLGPSWVRAVAVFVKARENGPAHFRCATIFVYAHIFVGRI